MNSVLVNKAFFLKQQNRKLLVFQNFQGTIKTGDVLSDGHTDYKIIGLVPNALSDTLSVEVECKNFNPDDLAGVELNY